MISLGVTLIVVGLFIMSWLIVKPRGRAVPKVDLSRSLSNARVRQVYRDAGIYWYPHELASGKVRWYRVFYDDAVEL